MKAFDIAKEAYQIWKRDVPKFLVPSAEYYVIAMVLGSLLAFGLLGLFSVVLIISMIVLIGGGIISSDPIAFFFLLLLLPFILMLTMLVVMPLVILFSAFMNGILLGGLSKSVLSGLEGASPRFGDVLKVGWRERYPLFKLELLKLVLVLVIVLLPIFILSFVMAPILLFPFLGAMVYYLFIMVLTVAIGTITAPLQFLPYILYWREGRRGWGAIKRSLSFIWAHYEEALGLGLLYQLSTLVLVMVPGVGIIVALLGPAFLITCLNILYEQKTGTRGPGMRHHPKEATPPPTDTQ